jgi:hypothetical protein
VWPAGACESAPGGPPVEAVTIELAEVTNNHTGIYSEAPFVSLRGNVAAASGGMGIYLYGATAADVRGNLIQHNGLSGLGIMGVGSTVTSDLAVLGNRIEANGAAGIQLQRLQMTQPAIVENNLVTGTLQVFDPATGTKAFGDGIVVTVGQGAGSYDVTIQDNTIEGSARNGVLYDGVGGAVSGNAISSSGGYGVVLQQSSATIGANTYSGNVSGDEVSYSSRVDLVSDLPGPLP